MGVTIATQGQSGIEVEVGGEDFPRLVLPPVGALPAPMALFLTYFRIVRAARVGGYGILHLLDGNDVTYIGPGALGFFLGMAVAGRARPKVFLSFFNPGFLPTYRNHGGPAELLRGLLRALLMKHVVRIFLHTHDSEAPLVAPGTESAGSRSRLASMVVRLPLASVPSQHLTRRKNLSRDEARRLAGLPPREKVLLHFGTMNVWKGTGLLLEAIPQVGVGATYVFAGVLGDYAEGAQSASREAARLGRPYRIEVRNGRQTPEEADALFRSADAVLLPHMASWGTKSSGVLLDALGSRRWVIGTTAGTSGRTIRALGAGLVAPAGSAGGFAAEIRAFIAGALPSEYPDDVSARVEAFLRANSNAVLFESLLREYRSALSTRG